jgi:hypothetical protein
MADTSIFSSLFEAAKKLPAQVVGGGVDLTNIALGGFANIADVVTGKPITREPGEGLVKKPVGGTEYLNDVFGISNKSSGLIEDSTGAVLNALTPAGAVTGATKAIIGAAAVLKSPKMVEVAEAALKAGTSPEQVFKYTGIYKGPVDNSLKAVIDDSSSKLRTEDMNFRLNSSGEAELSLPRSTSTNLEDLLDHPELYKKYPELRTLEIRDSEQKGAAYWAQLNRIDMGPARNVKEFTSNLLHETQHAIQKLEGFSQGASTAHFLPGADEFFTSLNKIKGAALEFKLKAAKESGLPVATIERYAIEDKAKLPLDLKNSESFQMYLRTRNAQAVANKVQTEAYNQYLKVGGEAEARAVQRMFEERTGPSFPLTAYDIPLDSLIQSPFSKVLPKTTP